MRADAVGFWIGIEIGVDAIIYFFEFKSYGGLLYHHHQHCKEKLKVSRLRCRCRGNRKWGRLDTYSLHHKNYWQLITEYVFEGYITYY